MTFPEDKAINLGHLICIGIYYNDIKYFPRFVSFLVEISQQTLSASDQNAPEYVIAPQDGLTIIAREQPCKREENNKLAPLWEPNVMNLIVRKRSLIFMNPEYP